MLMATWSRNGGKVLAIPTTAMRATKATKVMKATKALSTLVHVCSLVPENIRLLHARVLGASHLCKIYSCNRLTSFRLLQRCMMHLVTKSLNGTLVLAILTTAMRAPRVTRATKATKVMKATKALSTLVHVRLLVLQRIQVSNASVLGHVTFATHVFLHSLDRFSFAAAMYDALGDEITQWYIGPGHPNDGNEGNEGNEGGVP
jgi:hypothetical protein